MKPNSIYETDESICFSPYYFLAKTVSTYENQKHWYHNHGFTLADCKTLLLGKPITAKLADKIATATNSTTSMWLKIDKHYQNGKAEFFKVKD